MGLGIKKIIGRFNEAVMAKKSRESVREAHTRKRINTLLSNNSSFATTEAYKAIRTNIIFTLGTEHSGCKKIIITSAIPGEGKTTTCLNLAIAFAQTGSCVLVIDGDLRKPRIYRHLGLEKDNGLSDLLCGMLDLKDAIKKCEKHGIDCITSGQIPPNPVELMASSKMGETMEKLSEMYDYIFIDTAPVTVVTDATAIVNYVDGVVVVARQNYTIHESLQRAIANLKFADVKILGYILNDVTAGSQRYGAYRRYGYGRYGYGYGYGYSYDYGYDYGDKVSDGKEDKKKKRK